METGKERKAEDEKEERSKTANVKGRIGCTTSRKGTEDNLTIRKRSRRKIYILDFVLFWDPRSRPRESIIESLSFCSALN
jgi:hypothetical protein